MNKYFRQLQAGFGNPILPILLLGMVIAVFLTAGCTQKQRLYRIGLVDYDRVVADWPELDRQYQQYLQEVRQIQANGVNKPGQLSAAQQKKLKERTEYWQKISKQLSDQVREAAAEVAREEDLDMVLFNTLMDPVMGPVPSGIEFGGFDITPDLKEKLRSKHVSPSSPTPTGTSR